MRKAEVSQEAVVRRDCDMRLMDKLRLVPME